MSEQKKIIKIDPVKFNKVKQEVRRYYKSINKIKCPYLKDEVHFNVKGFQHLLSKSWGRGRAKIEQYTRLRLFPLAVKIISKSHTLQEYDKREILIRQNINSKWQNRKKVARYYVFIAIIKNVRLKVIIKEIEGGVKFFYSLYPSWKVIKDHNKNQKKVFYSGNLEVD